MNLRLNVELRKVAASWAGGREDACEFDHARHDVISVPTKPPGAVERIPFVVFNWFRYETPLPGYCTGRDEVSKGIQHALSWEASASELVWRFLRAGRPREQVVLDLGSHVGWYSALAGRAGYETLAVDADPEHLEVLALNAPAAVRCRAWVDDGLPDAVGLDVRLAKVDLEGAELAALSKLQYGAYGSVDAVLLEHTPERDSGPLEFLLERGFRALDADDRDAPPYQGSATQRNLLLVADGVDVP